MTAPWKIYLLFDKRTGKIVYVGRTTKTIYRRLQVNNNNSVAKRTITEMGDSLDWVVVDAVETKLEAARVEAMWIAHFSVDLLLNRYRFGAPLFGANANRVQQWAQNWEEDYATAWWDRYQDPRRTALPVKRIIYFTVPSRWPGKFVTKEVVVYGSA